MDTETETPRPRSRFETGSANKWPSRNGGPFKGRIVSASEKLVDLMDEIAGNAPLAPLDEVLAGLDITYKEYLHLQMLAIHDIAKRFIEEDEERKRNLPPEPVPSADHAWLRAKGRMKKETIEALELVKGGMNISAASRKAGADLSNIYLQCKRLRIKYKGVKEKTPQTREVFQKAMSAAATKKRVEEIKPLVERAIAKAGGQESNLAEVLGVAESLVHEWRLGLTFTLPEWMVNGIKKYLNEPAKE